jgi:O-acetyl-ADP-ribose deacetylase (regulator of RNase III)
MDTDLKDKIEIVQGDITKMEVDAIVTGTPC